MVVLGHLRFKNFLYESIKENVERGDQARPRHVVHIIIFVLMGMRCIQAMIEILFLGQYHHWWRYDIMASFFYRNSHIYDPLFLILMLIMCGLGVMSKWFHYFYPSDTWTWQIDYDIIVRNTDYYKVSRHEKAFCEELVRKRYDALIGGRLASFLPSSVMACFCRWLARLHCKKCHSAIWRNRKSAELNSTNPWNF